MHISKESYVWNYCLQTYIETYAFADLLFFTSSRHLHLNAGGMVPRSLRLSFVAGQMLKDEPAGDLGRRATLVVIPTGVFLWY